MERERDGEVNFKVGRVGYSGESEWLSQQAVSTSGINNRKESQKKKNGESEVWFWSSCC